ncbi:hypothetical protein [Thiobacillus sedimenti]|uniref:Uncharacterized protein n=1 Tax=Thiobacillus sedimenti TaxID=3110231 RepID=A0ABZ1CHX4_9PROT|nr:hypothetical protein [Thiobacillus sp. SCUT-2]WRS38545.1 hypothetical protein VA613_11085 [Thiobacillus sp. SCUT-2]
MKPPLKKRVPKPRNPYVAPALQRKAGAHEATPGARRAAEKRALQKRLAEQ